MSVSEQWLWSRLRKKQLGYLFKRQVPVGPYILDFYCPQATLCIEVDGEQHKKRRERDLARDEFLNEKGIETLRIPSLDLFDESTLKLSEWIEVITNLCAERSKK